MPLQSAFSPDATSTTPKKNTKYWQSLGPLVDAANTVAGMGLAANPEVGLPYAALLAGMQAIPAIQQENAPDTGTTAFQPSSAQSYVSPDPAWLQAAKTGQGLARQLAPSLLAMGFNDLKSPIDLDLKPGALQNALSEHNPNPQPDFLTGTDTRTIEPQDETPAEVKPLDLSGYLPGTEPPPHDYEADISAYEKDLEAKSQALKELSGIQSKYKASELYDRPDETDVVSKLPSCYQGQGLKPSGDFTIAATQAQSPIDLKAVAVGLAKYGIPATGVAAAAHQYIKSKYPDQYEYMLRYSTEPDFRDMVEKRRQAQIISTVPRM